MTSCERVRARRLLDWREGGTLRPVVPGLRRELVGRWVAGLSGDPYCGIRLDEVGTLVWRACDGRTLADVAQSMRSAFGDGVESTDGLLDGFLRRMLRAG